MRRVPAEPERGGGAALHLDGGRAIRAPLERSASWGRVGIKRSNSVKRPTHADPDSAAGPSGASAMTFRI